MSGDPVNIQLAAQLMKNISEEEFMVVVNNIIDELVDSFNQIFSIENSKHTTYEIYEGKYDKECFFVSTDPYHLSYIFYIMNHEYNEINFGRDVIIDIEGDILAYDDVISFFEKCKSYD